LLRPHGEYYETVTGHRRIEAARRAGIKLLRARVLDLSDVDALLLSILENEQREDWGLLEKANAYARLRALTGWSLRRIASVVQKDVSQISRYLRILDSPDPLKEMLTRGNGLSEGHLRWILKLPKPDQTRIARLVLECKLTTRETEMLVRRTIRANLHRSPLTNRIPEATCPINDLDPRDWKLYADQYNLQYYSVWSVRRHDPFFKVSGNVYAGCYPLIVPLNVLQRFSKVGGRVLDPFVGSGTTLVACAILNRLGLGVDLNRDARLATEKRFSIVIERDPRMKKALEAQRFIEGDSRDLFFLKPDSVDLVVTHPPYLDMKDYGPRATHHDSSEYQAFLRDSFSELHRVLKSQRYFCIQIAPYAAKHLPLHYEAYRTAKDVGFRYKDEAIIFYEDYVGYSSSSTGRCSSAQRKAAFGKYQSIATNTLLHCHEYLLFFQK
jgi:ParB/RepB/Spo0J family partition protein